METNEISGLVVSTAYRVHTAIGPGKLESAYEACMIHALRRLGLHVEAQVPIPIKFEGIVIDVGYRIDLLVERQFVVELKAVSRLHTLHQAQILSHIKFGEFPVGLLMNFNVLSMRDGIMRFVN